MSHNHCASQGHCSSHSHSHQHGCGCSHGDSSHHCHCPCCKSSHHSVQGCNFSTKLLEMADEAWMDVLKEKIKQQVLETSGKHLERLAKLVAESNNERWHHKMAETQTASDFKDKVAEFFKTK